MKLSAMAALMAAVCCAGPAAAYEYTLQFTPLGGAQGLVVAGYRFNGPSVVGNCSYHVTSGGGGGRGGGGHHTTTYFNQTCHWDLFGNLIGTVQGAPTAPKPISSVNGLTIYARNASGVTTGVDGARGFVNTPHAQYAWVSPSGGYVFLNNQQPVNLALTVRSVGEFPWALYRATATADLARASVKSTTCVRSGVRSGAQCTIVVTYDPSAIPGGDNPYTAYDHLSVSLVSNSGQAPVFAESIEVPISPAD